MKTIIVGTDFTPSSLNACKYAALLAQKLNCKLTIFNLFEAPLIHSNIGLYGIDYASAKSDSQQKIHKLQKTLSKLFPDVKLDMFVKNGSLENELEIFSAKHHVEAAVMGLESKNRISKFIWGSHGVDVAGRIKAPVIIVPQTYKKHKLSKVLLAVDNNEKLYKASLKVFEKFIKDAEVELQLLHVRTEDELFKPVSSELKINGKMITIEGLKATDIESGVKRFTKKSSIDLVSIISKKHSVLYDLFVESNTKKIAFAAKVPVMAIHE